MDFTQDHDWFFSGFWTIGRKWRTTTQYSIYAGGGFAD